MIRWKLRMLMADRRVSGKELAEALGVHRNTIQQLKEEHPTMIRLQYLESLCLALHCEPSDLLELTSESQEILNKTSLKQSVIKR